MIAHLADLFSTVCGQAAAHTWCPGGELLPCCQRCTGLYTGAFAAALLHWMCKPRLTGRFLEIHGLFLLVMIPFGYHWLPQGAALRAGTGVLFGFGLVTFLHLPLLTAPSFKLWREPADAARPCRELIYFAGVTAMVVLLPLAGGYGGHALFWALNMASAGGLLLLLLLTVACATVAAATLARVGSRLARRNADA